MPSGVNTGCSWPGRGQSVTELMPFMNFPVHSYTRCSDRHASPYRTFIRQWISMCFTLSLLKKRMTDRCSALDVCCKRSRHLYTTTAPSCCIPALYCHLSATLQTISITVVNFKDNRAVFRIFMALLKFSCIPLLPVGHSSNHQYHCSQLNKTIELWFVFLWHF